MRHISVSKEASDLGIINLEACHIKGLEIKPSERVFDEDISRLIDSIKDSFESIVNSEAARGFRELFDKMGYEDQLPAGERLVESFARKGFKSFNNVIDAYNIASAEFVAGLGMHDANKIVEDVRVFRAEGVEEIVPLFKDKKVTVKEGDLAYSTGERLLAWLGKKDVDSNDFKVEQSTSEVLLISLGNLRTPRSFNRAVCERVIELIGRTCPNIEVDFLPISSIDE